MDFVWAGERQKINTMLHFSLQREELKGVLTICAVDFYKIYIDGKFVSYGPERTAAGYSVARQLSLNNAKRIDIIVSYYGIASYACDLQKPFFGCEIINEEQIIAKASDFECYLIHARTSNVPRYSYQRGYLEIYDLSQAEEKLPTYTVDSPIILDGREDPCAYQISQFILVQEGIFVGFNEFLELWWHDADIYRQELEQFNINDFFERLYGVPCYDYQLEKEKTGFIRLEIEAAEETEIVCVFDEILPDGKWLFRRSECNDFVSWKVPKGKHIVETFEPYALKLLKVLISGEAKVTPFIRELENSFLYERKIYSDEKINIIFEAAEATFRQNSVDIFTDCPGRERAGWLCDSYFMGKAEKFFTGENTIERQFLRNYIIGKSEEITDGIFLSQCYPAESIEKKSIPNWAMWFIIELEDYYQRTGDEQLIFDAEAKVFSILDYFYLFENEYSLLEDLPGWVFIEWSKANSSDYVKGVNFPTNMLYAKCLESAYKLYAVKELSVKAQKIRKYIQDMSFDGTFFTDNAIRKDGKLVRCADHITETCQYYALFTGMQVDEAYSKRIMTEFGLKNRKRPPNIEPSNVFIGNYLRLFWLTKMGQYKMVLNESVEFFYKMAESTGTLWEHNLSKASCNHGFASVIAFLLDKCINKLNKS